MVQKPAERLCGEAHAYADLGDVRFALRHGGEAHLLSFCFG
jgi:hypothetical protein